MRLAEPPSPGGPCPLSPNYPSALRGLRCLKFSPRGLGTTTQGSVHPHPPKDKVIILSERVRVAGGVAEVEMGGETGGQDEASVGDGAVVVEGDLKTVGLGG